MLKVCIVRKTLKQYGLGVINYDDLKSLVLYNPHSSFSINIKNTLGLIPLWFKCRPQKFRSSEKMDCFQSTGADRQAMIFIITDMLSLHRSPVSGDADRLFPGNPFKYPFPGQFNIFRDKFRNLHRRFFSNGGVHTAIPDLAATILGFSMPSGTTAGCLTSAQRPGCGKILPGFNSSPGLKNSLTRIMFSRSSLL